MKVILEFATLFVLFSACRQESSATQDPGYDSSDSYAQHEPAVLAYDTIGLRKLEGIYEFVYPYNIGDLIENQYIKLVFEQENLVGKYYGTTDEFDQGREGYLPGFFVTDIHNLEVQSDSIKFVILCSDDEFFTKPIDLQIQSSDEAREQGYVKWNVKLRTNMKKYSGSVQGDTILINDEFDTRLYLRIK